VRVKNSGEQFVYLVSPSAAGFFRREGLVVKPLVESFHLFHGVGRKQENGRVEVAGRFIELPARNHLGGIDHGCEPFHGGGTDDSGVVRIALGVGAVEIDHGLLAFRDEIPIATHWSRVSPPTALICMGCPLKEQWRLGAATTQAAH
jgi:hypothetical protein